MSDVGARGKGEHPWVQPIFVAKTGAHETTVMLGALASLRVRFAPNVTVEVEDQFEQWLSGPFTKTVRRGSHEQLAKVLQWAQENEVPYAQNTEGDSSALALPPMRYEDMPKVMARLQVSGTDFARAEAPRPPDPLLTLHLWDHLTTGKATAQAAHGAWAYHLAHPTAFSDAQFEAGDFISVEFVTADKLAELASHESACSIRDNGLTEVDPQTLTVVALPTGI